MEAQSTSKDLARPRWRRFSVVPLLGTSSAGAAGHTASAKEWRAAEYPGTTEAYLEESASVTGRWEWAGPGRRERPDSTRSRTRRWGVCAVAGELHVDHVVAGRGEARGIGEAGRPVLQLGGPQYRGRPGHDTRGWNPSRRHHSGRGDGPPVATAIGPGQRSSACPHSRTHWAAAGLLRRQPVLTVIKASRAVQPAPAEIPASRGLRRRISPITGGSGWKCWRCTGKRCREGRLP